jgi:hypothetical protein
MSVDQKKKNYNNPFFIKKEEIKEEKIESALHGLRRLNIIQGYKNRIHLDGGEFLQINLIVYPKWKGKILFKTGNDGCNHQIIKQPNEYGIYYLGVSNETTKANIKTAIMEVLLIEMEKRETKNIALQRAFFV